MRKKFWQKKKKARGQLLGKFVPYTVEFSQEFWDDWQDLALTLETDPIDLLEKHLDNHLRQSRKRSYRSTPKVAVTVLVLESNFLTLERLSTNQRIEPSAYIKKFAQRVRTKSLSKTRKYFSNL